MFLACNFVSLKIIPISNGTGNAAHSYPLGKDRDMAAKTMEYGV